MQVAIPWGVQKGEGEGISVLHRASKGRERNRVHFVGSIPVYRNVFLQLVPHVQWVLYFWVDG